MISFFIYNQNSNAESLIIHYNQFNPVSRTTEWYTLPNAYSKVPFRGRYIRALIIINPTLLLVHSSGLAHQKTLY